MGNASGSPSPAALANGPALVWADEPTGNLDSTSAGEVLTLMRRLNQENGQTFVLVTHDPAVGALCDRIVRMQDGEILPPASQEA